MKKIIIAIDGHSSCGKSTLAKDLSKELGYVFIDTGAMYRAITLHILQQKIPIDSIPEIIRQIPFISLHFFYNMVNGQSEMVLNGVNVENEIRSFEVAENVSKVAAIKEVRSFAVDLQQKMGEQKGIIMDGRDIGTVVFPLAELKIFVTASIEVRVLRRYKELANKEKDISMEDIQKNLIMRDFIDSNREISPLKRADDAILLDNSDMDRQTQLMIAHNWVKQRILG